MQNHKNKMVTVILAAGASKRMGEPKQLLKWGDSTLLEEAIKKALQLKIDEVIVVLGANYDGIKPVINKYPITILNNTDWEAGLGKSIAFASEYILTCKPMFNGVFFVLSDQPFVSVTYLNNMLDVFKTCKSKIIATKYSTNKVGVPVVFDGVYLSDLAKLTGDNGAKSILKIHQDMLKTLAPNFENKDIDTKADYNKLRQDIKKEKLY
ncbi:nucleotidyltransferase family protein [Postechiella marina]|uniref:Nucleotidyltransferase family protein n=1 Tax=Postechiella marina TaxID=943941 RepID=A0ABP8BZB8_9FLAO